MGSGIEAESILIHFPNGIYGFENIKDFILLQEDEKKVIWSLQAAETAYPSLIVLDPFLILPNYRPALTEEQNKFFGNPKPDDLCYLAVAVIRKNLEDSAVNLKSPIVIHVKSRLGMQIILEDSNYPVQYRPFRKQMSRGRGACL
mgnify:CR=1 FL=1|jgi:flagellar assembly factor FliW